MAVRPVGARSTRAPRPKIRFQPAPFGSAPIGSETEEKMSEKTDSTAPALIPFALKDAPALIEVVSPAQKISAEAQKERKAVGGKP